jgi:SulP family sulfate permease
MNRPSRKGTRSLFRPRLFSLFDQPYSLKDVASDSAAGLTVGLIALPLALALGIASVPAGIDTPYPAPALGLFTAIIAGFLISSLGGSSVQIGGPTAAFVPVALLIIEKHGYGGLIAATVLAGILQIIMGLARMGTLIKFIPWPATSGFTTGIAVSIIATGVPDLLGNRVGASPRGSFWPRPSGCWRILLIVMPLAAFSPYL